MCDSRDRGQDAPKEDRLGVEGRLIIQERFVVYILIIVELPVERSSAFFVMPLPLSPPFRLMSPVQRAQSGAYDSIAFLMT